MRDIRFTLMAFEQYNDWLMDNKAIYNRLQKLILEAARTPLEGTGKPEALKHDLKAIEAGASTMNTAWCTGWLMIIYK